MPVDRHELLHRAFREARPGWTIEDTQAFLVSCEHGLSIWWVFSDCCVVAVRMDTDETVVVDCLYNEGDVRVLLRQGDAAMRLITDWAVEHGASCIYATVRLDHPSALGILRFHERLGMTQDLVRSIKYL